MMLMLEPYLILSSPQRELGTGRYHHPQHRHQSPPLPCGKVIVSRTRSTFCKRCTCDLHSIHAPRPPQHSFQSNDTKRRFIHAYWLWHRSFRDMRQFPFSREPRVEGEGMCGRQSRPRRRRFCCDHLSVDLSTSRRYPEVAMRITVPLLNPFIPGLT